MYLMQPQHPAPVRTDFFKKIGVLTTKFSIGMSTCTGVATAVLFIVLLFVYYCNTSTVDLVRSRSTAVDLYLSIDSSQTVDV